MKKMLMSVIGIGLGHATRSEAIYNKLKDELKIKILSYGDARNYFQRKGIPSEDFGGQMYKGEEFTFNMLFQINDFLKNPKKIKEDYKNFEKIADDFQPELILSDSEPNAVFYASNKKIKSALLTNVITTVMNYHILPKKFKTGELKIQNFFLKKLVDIMVKRNKIVFVPSFERRIKYKEKVEYVDLIVRKKPSEIDSEKELREKLGIKRKFYYVSVGGSDLERYLLNIFEEILPKFKDKFFIISSNYAKNSIIEKENMIIYPFIHDPFQYLKICEGVISTAGHSAISESIVYKKPMLVIPVRKHVEQMVNAALLEKNGFGNACFFEKRINNQYLIESLEKFFKEKNEIEANLKNLKFKGEGSIEIAKKLNKF